MVSPEKVVSVDKMDYMKIKNLNYSKEKKMNIKTTEDSVNDLKILIIKLGTEIKKASPKPRNRLMKFSTL